MVTLYPIKKDFVIEKRNVLNEMRASGWTLQELRFFSIYLSKINARDPKTRTVRFPLSDFERIMDLKRVQAKDIKPTVDNLLCKIVHVPINGGKSGYSAFQLFKECTVTHDNNGEWYVEIDAHDKAISLMFEFKTRYFNYQLWNALRLRSSNQLRMYEILKQYEKIGERTFALDELRYLLGIEPNEYPRWNNFKARVLDSCKKSLAETTDIKFNYEVIRKGRKGIVAVRFLINKNDDYIDQLTLDEFIELQDVDIESEEERKEAIYDEHLRFIAGAVDYEFTNTEVQMISSAISEMRGDMGRYNFIREQYMKLCRRAEQTKVPHRFDYLMKIIKNEVDK